MDKKLLIITHQFPSDAAPTFAMYNKQQFEALREFFKVDLIVPVDWITWLAKGVSARRYRNSLKPRYVPYFHTPKVFRRLYAFFMAVSLRSIVSKKLSSDITAVLATWAYPDAAAVVRLAESGSVPVFVKVHGSDVNVYCEKPALRRQIVRSLGMSAGVFCVSNAIRQKLIAYGVPEEKTLVVYNGVDRNNFAPVERSAARKAVGIGTGELVYVFLGNLLQTKGALDLVKAFLKLSENMMEREMGVLFIGDGPVRSEIEKQSRRLEKRGGCARIKVIGKVPHKELATWLNAANFVCLPSYNEGVPNALLEAMSCGTPVIASNVGGIPEVIPRQAGILVSPGDVDGLSFAMGEAVEMEWDRDEIRHLSARFCWRNNARQVHDAINKWPR